MPFELVPNSGGGGLPTTGGTITGNLVITGTLDVQSTVTFDVAQTTTGLFSAEGGILIDETGTEVLLVRAEADAGDVFAVNTTTPGVTVTGTLAITGATTIQGITILDLDGTEVFLIRKDGDGGDIFAVDADNAVVAITGSLTISTPLAVAQGGIGVATLTDGGLLLGSGTSALTALARGTAGQMLIGSTSGDPVMGTLAGVANEIAIVTGDGTLSVGLATNISVAGTLDVADATTLEGTTIIDITSTEAFLVRQNADAGDVFTVNTTTPGAILDGDMRSTTVTIDNNAWYKCRNSSDSADLDAMRFTSGDLLQIAGGAILVNTGLAETTFGATIFIDTTHTEALLVRKIPGGGDVFKVDTTNKRTLVGSLTATDQTFETLPEALSVAEGNFEVLDSGTLGAETITDGGFPNSTNWAGAGEWSDTISGKAIFTFSSTGNGTMTQTAAQRVTGNEGSNARWYKITYTTTSVVDAGGLTMSITNAFAAASVNLPTANGTYSVIFQSHATTADTADFVFDITSASGSDTLSLDDVTVKEIIGGNVILGGKLTGGGSDGLQISGGGTVSTFENDLGTVGSTETIDWRDGNHQKLTLDENLTITFIDPDAPTNLVVHLVQDGSGTNTVAWPSNVDWEGGTAPTITAGASAIDIITFYFDGTRYYGGFLQNFS